MTTTGTIQTDPTLPKVTEADRGPVLIAQEFLTGLDKGIPVGADPHLELALAYVRGYLDTCLDEIDRQAGLL